MLSERVAIHAVWAGCLMSCCALLCVTAVAISRPHETLDGVAVKLLALCGPITGGAGLLLARLAGRREEKREEGPRP